MLVGSSSKAQGDQLGALRWPREVGWEGERKAQRGGDMGMYVCMWLIHFVVRQRLTQYCEAIILQ